MLKLAAASLDDVKAEIRPYCVATEDGVMLDTTKLKTQKDIDSVVEAKRKETSDHSVTKQKLAAWQKLGETPDTVQQKIIDLESRVGTESELSGRVANLLRDNRKLSADLESAKNELDTIKPEYETQKKVLLEQKTYEVLSNCVNKIKGIDNVKLTQALRKDVLLGILTLDESGEGLTVKTGDAFEKYAKEQAEIFGFKLHNNPGRSKTFDEDINGGVQGGIRKYAGSLVDASIAEQLDG